MNGEVKENEMGSSKHAEKEVLHFLLENQFGELPPWAEAKLNEASRDEMETWTLRMFTETSLKDVFQ